MPYTSVTINRDRKLLFFFFSLLFSDLIILNAHENLSVFAHAGTTHSMILFFLENFIISKDNQTLTTVTEFAELGTVTLYWTQRRNRDNKY